MGIIATHRARNVGAASVQVLDAKSDRKYLEVQNNHATQSVRTKFGGAVSGDVTEVQTATFSAVPDAGSFKFRWNGNDTAAIAFGDDAAAVQVALRAVAGLSAVTVAGNFTTGFVITMTGATPNVDPDLPLLTTNTNTLEASAVPVAITVAETTKGKFADGYKVAAGATKVWSGNDCPQDAVHMLASGADTKVEIIEG